ncbi:hypothetical protein [Nonomuraea typhae]|uniref:hypothetical protein n=1 Tax=Nonomuraea typhae TaxID=2603600 RepID=UPI0012FB31B1|nr:hypothetical protein [Nonomuraea typhae]
MHGSSAASRPPAIRADKEALAAFTTAPAIDWDEVRADLDRLVDDELRDPIAGTGL